jgi:translation elongation factor P/translation initiation factor 5A
LISTSDFRKGLKIEFKGDPYEIVDFLHVKMGRGGANVKTKLRNLRTGSVVEETLRSGEKFPRPELKETKMQYIYMQDDLYYFMDAETYEQIPLNAEQLGEFLIIRACHYMSNFLTSLNWLLLKQILDLRVIQLQAVVSRQHSKQEQL